MELADQAEPRRAELLPVVRYAALQRARRVISDYWDHATLLEAAVAEENADAAFQTLKGALGKARFAWQLESTARNLRLVKNTARSIAEDRWRCLLVGAPAGALCGRQEQNAGLLPKTKVDVGGRATGEGGGD